MHPFSSATSVLLAVQPFAAASSPSVALARAVGGLLGLGLVYWLLWTSHGLRVLVWGLTLLGAVCRMLIVVASPGFSACTEWPLLAAGLGSVAFLLGIGWLGRTPERSRMVLLAVVGIQLALLAFAAGLVLLNPSAIPLRK
jgi:hypothetical protein